MQFRTIAGAFNLIDDAAQRSIIVQYEGSRRGVSSVSLIETLRRQGPSRWLSRKLQRFSVSVPKPIFDKIVNANMAEEVHGFFVQAGAGLYKPGLGLLAEEKKWCEELLLA